MEFRDCPSGKNQALSKDREQEVVGLPECRRRDGVKTHRPARDRGSDGGAFPGSHRRRDGRGVDDGRRGFEAEEEERLGLSGEEDRL